VKARCQFRTDSFSVYSSDKNCYSCSGNHGSIWTNRSSNQF